MIKFRRWDQRRNAVNSITAMKHFVTILLIPHMTASPVPEFNIKTEGLIGSGIMALGLIALPLLRHTVPIVAETSAINNSLLQSSVGEVVMEDVMAITRARRLSREDAIMNT